MVVDTHSRTVLLVDDDGDACAMLADLVRLSEPGAVVLTARDGAQGVLLATLCHPGVVVLDLEMPVLDGTAAAMQLRAKFGRSIVLIATSGNPARLDSPASRSLFDARFLKPIDVGSLLAAMFDAPRAHRLPNV